MTELLPSDGTESAVTGEVEMFAEILLPGLSVRLVAQHVVVGDGQLRPSLDLLAGEELEAGGVFVPADTAVGETGVVDPVDDWEDSHQTVITERQGVGEEDSKVCLRVLLVIETSVEVLLGLPTLHKSHPDHGLLHHFPRHLLPEHLWRALSPGLLIVLLQEDPGLGHTGRYSRQQQRLLLKYPASQS